MRILSVSMLEDEISAPLALVDLGSSDLYSSDISCICCSLNLALPLFPNIQSLDQVVQKQDKVEPGRKQHYSSWCQDRKYGASIGCSLKRLVCLDRIGGQSDLECRQD